MALRKELTKLDFADGTVKTLFGRNDIGVADDIVLGSGLQMVGNVLSATGGGGGGTITSINVTGGSSGLNFSGGPVTSGTGVITIGSGILTGPFGGTGHGTMVVGDLLVANTTSSWTRLAAPAADNALISVGVNNMPIWGKISLTSAVSGTLPVTSGGNGFNLYTLGAMLYASSTTAFSQIPAGTNGQVLTIFGNVPQWITPGAGSGTVTQFSAGNLSPIFTTSVANATTSPALSFTLTTQAPNLFFGSPLVGSGAPSFRGIGFADLPLEGEDIVSTTTYTLVVGDNKRIKRFTNISGCAVTLPASSFSIGYGVMIVRAVSAGVVSFVTAGGSGYEGVSSSLGAEKTSAYIYHRGSNNYAAYGALSTGTGITNVAANTELAQSDGTNLVDSGLFIPSKGSLTLGSGTISGNRSITINSSDAASNLTLRTKGATNSFIIDKQGGATSSLTANAYIVLGSAADTNTGIRTITTNGAGTSESIVIAPRGGTTIISSQSGGDVQVNISALGSNYFLSSTSGNGHILNGGQNGNTTALSFKIYGNFGTSLSTSGTGVIINGGDAYQLSGNGSGGDVQVKSGLKLGSGTPGNITFDSNLGQTFIKSDAVFFQGGTGNTVGGPYVSIAQRTGSFPLTSGNNVVLYGQDSSDNTVALSLYTEQVVEAIGTFTPTQKYKIQINGLFYWISLDPVI